MERDYYLKTRIFPPMHIVAIRRDVYEKNRWVAQSLYKAFVEAQKKTYEGLKETAALKGMLPWFNAHVEEAFELQLAVRNASVEQPVAAEHPVLVRRAGDVCARAAGRARHEPDRLESRFESGARQDRSAKQPFDENARSFGGHQEDVESCGRAAGAAGAEQSHRGRG